jgi:hypothetical protein
MRSAALALVLVAGCARSGTDLFKKIPLPDASSDAFVVPPVDANVDAAPVGAPSVAPPGAN